MKFFVDNSDTNLTEIFQKMLNYSNVNVKIDNYNFIKDKKNNNFSKKIPIDKYIHIHLDEKWFNHLYIQKYTNINPNFNEFINFIDKISKHENILITTGLVKLNLINELIDKKIFEKIDTNIFFKKKNTKSIFLINELTFDDIAYRKNFIVPTLAIKWEFILLSAFETVFALKYWHAVQ